jgi:hypothetical protein
MIDVSVLPWAEIGFWFSAVWVGITIIGIALLIKNDGDDDGYFITIGVMSLSVAFLCVFGMNM